VKEIAAKYIEGEPQIAEVALNADELTEAQITGLNTEDSSLNEGTITYDIRFIATVPMSGELIKLIINVEAQNDFYPGYPLIKRGIYYCSRMISAQYETEFTAGHYENIKKVYSVWIWMNPPKERRHTITRYQFTEENVVGHVKENKAYYDLLTVIMVCLGDVQNARDKSVLHLLEVLLSNEKLPNEKKKILSEDFNIAMTKTLEGEVQEMCNLSKGVEEKAMAKGLAQGLAQGLEQGVAQGLAQGLEQGVAQGLAQGLEQGVAQERMEIAKALLDILDDETIALKTGLRQEEVCRLRNNA
jgi:hypothetical protein